MDTIPTFQHIRIDSVADTVKLSVSRCLTHTDRYSNQSGPIETPFPHTYRYINLHCEINTVPLIFNTHTGTVINTAFLYHSIRSGKVGFTISSISLLRTSQNLSLLIFITSIYVQKLFHPHQRGTSEI